MEDLKQLEPSFPRDCKSSNPAVPEKKPIEPEAASIALGDMKPSYSSALKNQPSDNPEPASPSPSSESDAMGFTKVEMPVTIPENGIQSKGPRQALPKGLVATRFANHPAPRPQSPASTVTSASFVECDLIDFETDVSSPLREPSGRDSAKPAFRNEKDVSPNNELRLYREIDDLRQKLKSSAARAEIAEEKADRMEKRIEEIKNTKASTVSEGERDINSVNATLQEVKAENAALKEQLRDAQSHIFSLQPYRKELTPEEVGREYDDLIEGVTDWVARFMGPLLDNHSRGADELLLAARKKPTEANRLKRMLHSCPDLVHGSMYPETDEDIIIGIIMRFLNDNIFQKILYGAVTTEVEALSFVETAMQNHVEPKRDLFAIRTWNAEAYNAIISSRQFASVRVKRMEQLTLDLASIFSILCKKSKEELFCKKFEEHCIKPAMKLYEKIQVSTHHFYFDMNPCIMWGPEGEFLTSPDFMDNLQDLDCKNILQNRKAFNLNKMDPTPSKKELYQHLLNVCTVTPALLMRQVGRKDVIREPQLVCRQQMLVAWGPTEKRESFRENGEQTLLSHLYSAKCERERAEAGGWTPFRWPG